MTLFIAVLLQTCSATWGVISIIANLVISLESTFVVQHEFYLLLGLNIHSQLNLTILYPLSRFIFTTFMAILNFYAVVTSVVVKQFSRIPFAFFAGLT